LVGDLGLLGKTVVVDHGCGISTVYAHLSETAINQGALVSKGDPVGRTGSSGLSVTEGVYFEIRVSGTPVTANEWWDETWVRDHIDNKVGFVLRALVGASGE
jgi:septal ring factor EnvC (AmiA/AmiB activator)